MEVEILSTQSGRVLTTLQELKDYNTIRDVKNKYAAFSRISAVRQSFRLEARGRSLNDDETLKNLGFVKTGRLYFKDLGPQIGWSTVFFCEYASPLLAYLVFYMRPTFVYNNASAPVSTATKVAALCWSGHFVKRILETLFVHRFSHGTMPLFNLFKNCGFYAGFAVFVGYVVNHPLYTPPAYGINQIYAGLALFLFAEMGNFSIHLALRNLRPEGSTDRPIPHPTSNPFTALFSLVSCPNYTYEALSWIGFTIITQSLPSALFMLTGLSQMTAWALKKHRAYQRVYPTYPRSRKAIIPFIV